MDAEMLEELTLRGRLPSPSHSYFVAHEWEGARHADNAMRTKHGWLMLLKRHLSVPAEKGLWLWMDFFSIPADDQGEREMAERSTLHYCQVRSLS